MHKRILIVGPAHPLRGGLATYDERLCRELMNMGHQAEILSFRLQYPDFLFPGKTQYSTEPAPKDIVIRSLINSINPSNWLSLGLMLRKQRYDIIIFRYWMSFMAPCLGTLARLARSNNHTRIIAITDNVIPHEKRFFDSWITPWFLGAAHGYLTMSKSVLEQLKNIFIKNKKLPSAYVPHPMYDMFGEEMSKTDARKKLGLVADEKIILFFGFIRKYKGLQLLLEAMKDERIAKLGIKLLVAGEFYENADSYFDLVQQLDVEDRVIMANDFIPDSEVAAHFCAADLVVQPYLNATQSGVTQIAYFYNKPMIVTNVGGLSELVPHNKCGYVVQVSASAIADAIVDYYTEQKEATMSDAVKKEKSRFTWRYLCETLLTLE